MAALKDLLYKTVVDMQRWKGGKYDYAKELEERMYELWRHVYEGEWDAPKRQETTPEGSHPSGFKDGEVQGKGADPGRAEDDTKGTT